MPLTLNKITIEKNNINNFNKKIFFEATIDNQNFILNVQGLILRRRAFNALINGILVYLIIVQIQDLFKIHVQNPSKSLFWQKIFVRAKIDKTFSPILEENILL